MTETRRTRPILATAISVWEVFVVAIAVAGHVAIRMLHDPEETAHPPYPFHHASALHVPGLVIGYALAIASAIALWQMHRSAFVLLAARAVVVLAVPILAPAAHSGTLDSLVPVFLFIIDVFAFALNVAIAWYAYKITKPKRRRRRRHRTHRSRRTSQSTPAPEAIPEPTLEAIPISTLEAIPIPKQEVKPAPAPVAQDEPLTTSQFYLSPDHEKTIRKD